MVVCFLSARPGWRLAAWGSCTRPAGTILAPWPPTIPIDSGVFGFSFANPLTLSGLSVGRHTIVSWFENHEGKKPRRPAEMSSLMATLADGTERCVLPSIGSRPFLLWCIFFSSPAHWLQQINVFPIASNDATRSISCRNPRAAARTHKGDRPTTPLYGEFGSGGGTRSCRFEAEEVDPGSSEADQVDGGKHECRVDVAHFWVT